MRNTVLAVLAAGAVVLSGAAVAQQPAPAPAPAAAPKIAIPPAFVRAQAPGQTLARDRLIGAKVHNVEGSIIGDIEDLILGQNNQIVGVIMGVGGVLGLGEKKIGVQYGALRFTQKDGKTHIVLPAASKEVLAAVPAYVRLEARKGLIERGKEKGRELIDKTKETAGPAVEKAKDAAGKAYEKAKDATGHAIDKAKEAVKGAPTAPADKK